MASLETTGAEVGALWRFTPVSMNLVFLSPFLLVVSTHPRVDSVTDNQARHRHMAIDYLG